MFRGKHEEGNAVDPTICHANDSDSSDESGSDIEKIQRNLEYHEKVKALTGEETVVINLGSEENPR